MYTPPTKFFPVLSESLQYQQETIWRRPIRKTPDVVGAVQGNAHVEGDIEMEALEDVVPYFLACARTVVRKTTNDNDDDGGCAPSFCYTFTGMCSALPPKTMSVTVVRNGRVFGYTGCVVGSITFTPEDVLQCNVSLVGRDEQPVPAPVEVFTTTIPFGPGQYRIEIPHSNHETTQVFDTDGFEFAIDESAEAQYRLQDNGPQASFVAFGEREVTASTERDFTSRTEYETFKALTARAIRFGAVKSPHQAILLDLPAAIVDTYEVNLGGQGDLVRASVEYQGVIDDRSVAYTITVKTHENLTL